MSFEFDTAIERIAPSLVSLAHAYQQAPRGSRLARYLASTVNHMCRELEDFVSPLVSCAAHELAAEADPELDLTRCHWDHRYKHPVLRERLHWEHMMPVGVLRKRVLNLQPMTDRAVAEVLLTAKVAWITKEENAALKAKGFGAERPDPAAAYEACGIRLRSSP